MKIEILKPIGGTGDFVVGFRHIFHLERGMKVEVEDRMARQWISAGIAKDDANEKPAVGNAPEIEMLATPPEKAVLPRAKAKPRKVSR